MTARVVVTGASGFVGRSLVRELAARQCVVETLGREDSGRGSSYVVDRVAAFAPEAVVHLATHFLASHRPEDLAPMVRANVEWGTVVAEATHRAGARLVTIDTAWQHFEGRDYDPVSLYAATKQAFDVILVFFARRKGLDVRTVTLFDTYGPGDDRAKLVPALFRAAATGAPLEMSDGLQLIDLTFVDDIARGIADVALQPDAPADCVLRSWRPVTIREVVHTLEEAIGRPVQVDWDARPRRSMEMREDWVFGQSPRHWVASVSLEDGMRKTWDAIVNGGWQS
jgi:nucleoside-diphosphate-sugar epimerase